MCLICARKNKETSVVRIEWKRWKVVNEDREVIRSCNTLRAKVNRHTDCFSEWYGPVADFKQRRRQRKKKVDWSSREGDDSGLYHSSSNGDEKGSNSSYFQNTAIRICRKTECEVCVREQDSRIIPKYSDLSNYNNGITDTEDYFKNIQTIIDYLIFTQKDSISTTWELVTNAGYLSHHSRPSE